jgi:hypothetical protein
MVPKAFRYIRSRMNGHRERPAALHTRHRSPIFGLDPHGEIIAIDVERDVHVLRV